MGLLLIAFLLGIKHSVDADHVVAISSILTRSEKFTKTVKLSMSWAVGHMITASLITFILFSTKDLFLEKLLGNFEIIVSLMLILIGVLTLLWEFNVISWGKHSHGHVHEKDNDSELHSDHVHNQPEPTNARSLEHGHFLGITKDTQTMAGIGIIHGLASNDELLILLTLTLGLNDFSIILFGLLIFSLGVVIGMIAWGSILNLPIINLRKESITKTMSVLIAFSAIAYGIYTLFGGNGINLLPAITE